MGGDSPARAPGRRPRGALLTAEVDPCAALVLAAAAGAYGEGCAKLLQTSRQWPDDLWPAATARLTTRGWLGADGTLTPAGHDGHQAVEDTTDRLAATAYDDVPPDALDRLTSALRPLASRIAETNALPYPNAVGVDPRPGP